MRHVDSLPRSQKPTFFSCPEPDPTIPHSLRSVLILSCRLRKSSYVLLNCLYNKAVLDTDSLVPAEGL